MNTFSSNYRIKDKVILSDNINVIAMPAIKKGTVGKIVNSSINGIDGYWYINFPNYPDTKVNETHFTKYESRVMK